MVHPEAINNLQQIGALEFALRIKILQSQLFGLLP